MINANDIEFVTKNNTVPFGVRVKNISRTSAELNKMRKWCNEKLYDKHYYSRGDFFFETEEVRSEFIATFVLPENDIVKELQDLREVLRSLEISINAGVNVLSAMDIIAGKIAALEKRLLA